MGFIASKGNDSKWSRDIQQMVIKNTALGHLKIQDLSSWPSSNRSSETMLNVSSTFRSHEEEEVMRPAFAGGNNLTWGLLAPKPPGRLSPAPLDARR